MTYFVDLHVLGETPQHIRDALNAWRKDVKETLATGEGDVVGKASASQPAQAPFPAVGMVGTTGAVFDYSSLSSANGAIEKTITQIAKNQPGVHAVVAVWWNLEGESVKFAVANSSGQLEQRMVEDGALVEDALGQSLMDALGDDEALDGIGDKLLPAFLDPPPGPLGGLFAQQRQADLDETLEPVRKPGPKTRF